MTLIAVIAASTVGWPILQLAVFWLRFQRFPPGGPVESLVFAPLGFLSGAVAAVLLARSSSPRQRRFVGWGYLAATPIAVVTSLLGGLVLPGVWGPLAFGTIPLALGCLIGFAAGRTGGTA